MAYTTINKSTDYFNTKLYTGNGSAGHGITGVGFQPDWVWIKNRSYSANHMLYDAVRGATKAVFSNDNAAENTSSGHLTAFGTDGFTLGDNSGTGSTNGNNETYASWNWKAGGAGSANTDGDINSSVSANTTAGFSIVKWTGNGTQSDQEIGTGLSEELKFVISKPLATGGTTNSWLVYVNGVTDAQDNCLILESTTGLITGASGGTSNKGTTAGRLLIKAGTSGNNNLNNSGTDYIAYCFAEKTGYSKFGTFTGNGSADGTFCFTGFKPAFVIWKNTTSAGYYWHTMDNKREPNNPAGLNLFPNLNNAENDYGDTCDFVSNGFKFRTGSSGINTNGQVYIFMAFGQSLVGSNNVPCTSR